MMCLKKDLKKISGTFFFFFFLSPAILHPATGQFCQSELRAVGQKNKQKKTLNNNKQTNIKTCPETAGGFSLSAEELETFFLPRCPKCDRAVKGEGDEVDTGPMTVVTSHLLFFSSPRPLPPFFFTPPPRVCPCVSLSLCRSDTFPP